VTTNRDNVGLLFKRGAFSVRAYRIDATWSPDA
jgi:hypothetical protein